MSTTTIRNVALAAFLAASVAGAHAGVASAQALAQAGAQAPAQTQGSPFAGVDVSALVMLTPGVTKVFNEVNTGRPFVKVELGGKVQGEGFISTGSVSTGQTIDGDWLMTVPLDSGTVHGVYAALVYRATDTGPAYLGTLTSKGGKLDLTIHDGHVFAIAPVYSKHDEACCPSHKVIKRILYNESKGGLVEVSRTVVDLATPAPSPPPQ